MRPSVPAGVLAATAVGTLVLSANPFLLPAVADAYDIDLVVASLTTTVQLGGFVVGSWVAGRHLQPRRRVFVAACAIAVVVNLGSATLPAFALLVALRALSGLALGLIAWFGWVLVFGSRSRMSDVAVVGPLVGVVGAPVLAWLADDGGADRLFLFLGIVALVPLALNAGTALQDPIRRHRVRHRPVAAAAVLLAALGLMTFGASAVFTYGAVIAAEATGLSSTAIALGYSLNALAAVPSSRAASQRGHAAGWMVVMAGCALALGAGRWGWLFFAAMATWGFAFWMAVPGVFALLAARSRFPEERAGDAQAVMALGRVFGPLMGGAILDGATPTGLGITGAAVVAVAATLVIGVSWGPRPRVGAEGGVDTGNRFGVDGGGR